MQYNFIWFSLNVYCNFLTTCFVCICAFCGEQLTRNFSLVAEVVIYFMHGVTGKLWSLFIYLLHNRYIQTYYANIEILKFRNPSISWFLFTFVYNLYRKMSTLAEENVNVKWNWTESSSAWFILYSTMTTFHIDLINWLKPRQRHTQRVCFLIENESCQM